MPFIKLSRGLRTRVDEEDAYLARWKWFALKGRYTYYAARNVTRNGKHTLVLMHRVIANAPKGVEVDHVDHKGLNNTRKNLRFATRSENACNSRKHRDGASGYKGVSWRKDRGRWEASICVNRRSQLIGFFSSRRAAARAYDARAAELHGEFAALNFPERMCA